MKKLTLIAVVSVLLVSAPMAWADLNNLTQFPTPTIVNGTQIVGVNPAFVGLPSGYTVQDFVDIGLASSEAGHTMTSWGPIEPATSGGSWGGTGEDCRVIWDPAAGSMSATIDMDFGAIATITKFIAVRWLDGAANTGGQADDSFSLAVGGTVVGNVINGTTLHSEAWHDMGVWDVGKLTGTHTVTLTATSGVKWSGWDTYGQVAFSEIATYVPVPGAFLLGAMGLGMVGWLKRRKDKAEA